MTRKKFILGSILLIAAFLILTEVVAYWPFLGAPFGVFGINNTDPTNHSVGELAKSEGFGSPVSAQSPSRLTEPESGQLTIYGYVYDNISGDKISNATISISLFINGGLGGSSRAIRNIKSDDFGFYSVTLDKLHNDPDQIDRFPYQDYHLTTTHKNFMSAVKYYGYDTFENKIDFYLEPAGLIEGVVYDDKGNTLNDSSVGIYSSNLDFIDIARTGDKGQYQLNQIKPGTYNLIASSRGYDNFIKPQITFKKGEELNETIYLNWTKSNITLKGKVSDTNENEFVKLMLIKDNNEMTITTTDKDGNFESTLFSTGKYMVKAIPYFGGYYRSATIEQYIYIGSGENFETIDPQIAVP
ncbi:MAG: carboxypeptidase regulatory-like domain-containing protein [Candidatus Methanoperedens sp.]|nr:carboxypeptidase regulatory-like domain-containing protein [Candidatus Methanoperedens sp.]